MIYVTHDNKRKECQLRKESWQTDKMNIESIIKSGALQYDDGLSEIVEEVLITENRIAVDMLTHLMISTKQKSIQSNCIKILYEIGRGNSILIHDDFKIYLKLLKSKNNRLVWGSMYAIASIAKTKGSEVVKNISDIIHAMRSGSRITIDGGIQVLATLSTQESSQSQVFPLLIQELNQCDSKKLPAYIEESLICTQAYQKEQLLKIIENRITEFEKTSQIKRLKKSMKKLSSL